MAGFNPDNIDIEQLIREKPEYDEWCQKISRFRPIADEVIEEKGRKDWEPGVYHSGCIQKTKWNSEIRPVLMSVLLLNTVKSYLNEAGADFLLPPLM